MAYPSRQQDPPPTGQLSGLMGVHCPSHTWAARSASPTSCRIARPANRTPWRVAECGHALRIALKSAKRRKRTSCKSDDWPRPDLGTAYNEWQLELVDAVAKCPIQFRNFLARLTLDFSDCSLTTCSTASGLNLRASARSGFALPVAPYSLHHIPDAAVPSAESARGR